MIQTQKIIQSIKTHLIKPNPDLTQYFQQHPTQKWVQQIVILLRQAICNRKIASNQSSLVRKKKDITPKVTQIYQQITSPLKIYGKARVMLDNDIGCAIHNNDSIQQSHIQEVNKGKGVNKRKSKGTTQNIKIENVLSFTIHPFDNKKHHKDHAKDRKIGQITTVSRKNKDQIQYNKLKQHKIRKQSIFKRIEDRVTQKNIQMQHHDHHIGCSCSQNDQEIQQKLQEMYDTIKIEHQNQQKRLKTYKITSNFDYPITSSSSQDDN